MNTTASTTVQIFVTDYAAYNAGEQFKAGEWYNLADYSDLEGLKEAIQEKYNKEYKGVDISELELMITDYEGFPASLYSESFDDKTVSDLIHFANLDDEQREILQAFINCFGGDFSQALENYEDAYQGEFSSDEDFAENIAEEIGFENPKAWPYNCIDWERAARDLMHDYSESNGRYFSSSW